MANKSIEQILCDCLTKNYVGYYDADGSLDYKGTLDEMSEVIKDLEKNGIKLTKAQ